MKQKNSEYFSQAASVYLSSKRHLSNRVNQLLKQNGFIDVEDRILSYVLYTTDNENNIKQYGVDIQAAYYIAMSRVHEGVLTFETYLISIDGTQIYVVKDEKPK